MNNLKTLTSDVAIIGASLGGLRAAIAAASDGKRVVLTEETDWVGGQLTSQAVPPDENLHIETQGSTASYRDYRRRVRDYYRSLPDIADDIRNADCFDPGGSWVSRIAHEPCVAHKLLTDELRQFIEDGRLTLLLEHSPKSAVVDGDVIRSVTVVDAKSKAETVIEANIFLDGTDCGDLLPLVGAEYNVGAESKAQTGEPGALDEPCSGDMQPCTWVFGLELVDELLPEDRIQKPSRYEYYASMTSSYDDNKILSWYCISLEAKKKRMLRMFNGELGNGSLGLWEYRRVRPQSHYKSKINELSLINWPQQDYVFGNIFEDGDAAYHRAEAKSFAHCLAYWIQNEAPRIDGGVGYPVRLAKGALGTYDGFAKAPYIRESRRIVAKHTIREQDVSVKCTTEIREYPDSVGVGWYSLDVHETTVTHTPYNTKTNPFEIPLGAFIPIRMKNLLPACKNIGTTHLTSACYRLHPIEWNIGESAGHLAAFCVERGVSPATVWSDAALFEQFRQRLIDGGVQLHWK